MEVLTRKNEKAILTISKGEANAKLKIGNRDYLVAFIRDGKKVVIKNDLLLSEHDMKYIKEELGKFIKKEELKSKKNKR